MPRTETAARRIRRTRVSFTEQKKSQIKLFCVDCSGLFILVIKSSLCRKCGCITCFFGYLNGLNQVQRDAGIGMPRFLESNKLFIIGRGIPYVGFVVKSIKKIDPEAGFVLKTCPNCAHPEAQVSG